MQLSKHFVLVHGMGHGAWCWYKLKPLLESAGHRVTALDMGGSGINTKPVEELRSFKDYNEPLISFMSTSLPEEEKVVLVGHSLGGYNLAFAMEEFPEKIEAAVFVSALVPDTINKPSYFYEEVSFHSPVLLGYLLNLTTCSFPVWFNIGFFSVASILSYVKLFKKITVANGWLDTQFSTFGSPDELVTVGSFGPKFLSTLYDFSPTEDYELAKMLVRPLPNYTNDLAEAEKFSDGRYGSVRRVFVIPKEDKAIPEEFVWQMIESSGIKEVKELEGADHMPMLSKPQQLCNCLVQIAMENPSK